MSNKRRNKEINSRMLRQNVNSSIHHLHINNGIHSPIESLTRKILFCKETFEENPNTRLSLELLSIQTLSSFYFF